MSKGIEALIYLGPEGSFSHEVALYTQANHPEYKRIGLKPASSITEVCQRVVNGEASSGIVPIENSTDGPVVDGLKGFRNHPLRIHLEYVHPISQSLYYQRDINIESIKRVISKDSALGQCRRTVAQLLPGAILEPRDSTVAAILEVAKDPTLAAIGPKMAARIQGLSETLIQIDNIHDNPLNATRFFVVDSQNLEAPMTGNDKTSLIMQMPDRPGSLFTVLDTLAQQGINLTKIKSFGRSKESVAFFISILGHQRELPLNRALAQLLREGVEVKMLGSYPQYDYQPPSEVLWEMDMEYAVDQLRSGILNGGHNDDKTIAVFTLEDKVGALRNALEPFARRRINLTDIDSLPTGRLGEYIFYLSFNNGVGQKEQALDELATHCTRMVLL